MTQFSEQELDVLGELSQAIKQFRHLGIQGDANGQSSITVHTDGIGVWIATTCCIVMVVVGLLLTILVIDQKRQIDRLDDYLQAIYTQAPQLKPKDEK